MPTSSSTPGTESAPTSSSTSSNHHNDTVLYHTIGTGKLNLISIKPEPFTLAVPGKHGTGKKNAFGFASMVSERLESFCREKKSYIYDWPNPFSYTYMNPQSHEEFSNEINQIAKQESRYEGCRNKYINPDSFKSLNKLIDLEARLGQRYPNGFIVLGTNDTNDDSLSPTFWDRLTKSNYEYRRSMSETPVTVDNVKTYINRYNLTSGQYCGEQADTERNKNFQERSKLLNKIS